MADQTSPKLTERGSFRHFTTIPMRFCDTDKLGHVNNVAIAAYVEAARCEIYYQLLARAGTPRHIDFILARVAIDYRSELFYPGKVEVGARFVRLGTKSITTGYGIFHAGSCVASAECVNVFYDLDRRAAMAPTPELRRLLEAEVAV